MKKKYSLFVISFALLFLLSGTALAICDESNGGTTGLIPCGNATQTLYTVTVRCTWPFTHAPVTTSYNQTQAANLDDAKTQARNNFTTSYGCPIPPTVDSSSTNVGLVCVCQLTHAFILTVNIYKFVLWYVMIPFAGLMVVVGGVLLVVSAGNPGLASTAKKILLYTLIGMALALASWLIVDIILKTVGYTGNWQTLTF
jgi:hypothetical protein